jgi:hypothetical protein
MIEDGRAYGVALIVQRLLKKLEQKGILSSSEKVSMLDDVSEEIRHLVKDGAIAPSAGSEALRTVGLMHVKPSTEP